MLKQNKKYCPCLISVAHILIISAGHSVFDAVFYISRRNMQIKMSIFSCYLIEN